MSELGNQYRSAPKLRAPESLNRKVLGEAARRAKRSQDERRLPRFVPIVSTFGVAVFAGVLFIRNGDLTPEAITPTTVESTADVNRSDLTAPFETDVSLAATDTSGTALPQQKQVQKQMHRPGANDVSAATVVNNPGNRARAASQPKAVGSERIAAQSASSVAMRPRSVADQQSVLEMQGGTASVNEDSVFAENSALAMMDESPGQSWLSRQPPHYFSIFIAAESGPDIQQLRSQTGLISAIVNAPGNGWVLGSFSTKSEALSAIAAFGLSEMQVKVIAFNHILTHRKKP